MAQLGQGFCTVPALLFGALAAPLAISGAD